MATPAEHPPRFIARQLALGFGAVSFVAVAMCATLLSIIHEAATLVSGMRHDEAAIRRGLELATAVREQYIHIAHTLIEADDAHLEHYGGWRERVRTHLQQLAAEVPPAERWRLQALGEKTQRMHEQFTSSALPALRQGDALAVQRIHRDIDALAGEAAAHADALARAVESRMAHAHVLATDATRLGLIGGGLFVFLTMALSVGFTFRLRASVLKPLEVLTTTAQRFGRGDFNARVGEAGRGELGELSRAFDHMANELRAREARLVRHERMAAIGQLAAGVAHELNNPIGIIRGYLKTMTPGSGADTLREELAILDEEAAHCQRIAEDLLAYARTHELDVSRFGARGFLEETVRRFQETPGAGSREIRVDAGPGELEADRARIRQVVLNLLGNAHWASPPGTSLRVGGEASGGHYRIDVDDQGPGVAPEDRDRIFEPFFSRRPGGSGLGLPVCLGIMQAHGGGIEVLEAPGGGARFRVSLPLCQPRPAGAPVEARV